jgi:hypothetical protein
MVKNAWEWFKKNSIAFVIGAAGIFLFLFTGKEVLHHGKPADRARENAERAKENIRRTREDFQKDDQGYG